MRSHCIHILAMLIPARLTLVLLAAVLSGPANARPESKLEAPKLPAAENAPVAYTPQLVTHDSRTSIQRRQDDDGVVPYALNFTGVLDREFPLLSSTLSTRDLEWAGCARSISRFQVGCSGMPGVRRLCSTWAGLVLFFFSATLTRVRFMPASVASCIANCDIKCSPSVQPPTYECPKDCRAQCQASASQNGNDA